MDIFISIRNKIEKLKGHYIKFYAIDTNTKPPITHFNQNDLRKYPQALMFPAYRTARIYSFYDIYDIVELARFIHDFAETKYDFDELTWTKKQIEDNTKLV